MLLIDTPRWPWRGQLWAHMVSDESLDELHDAARSLGLRWLAFGLDHYDVSEHQWEQVCEIAELVDSRDIIRSLRSSGLRVPGGKARRHWRPVGAEALVHVDGSLRNWIDETSDALPDATFDVLARPGELVAAWFADRNLSSALASRPALPSPTAQSIVTEGDRWSLEVVLVQQEPSSRSTTPTRPLR